MAHQIVFIEPDKVNNKEYKKGDGPISVGDSIYNALKAKGSIKDFVPKKSKSEKE